VAQGLEYGGSFQENGRAGLLGEARICKNFFSRFEPFQGLEDCGVFAAQKFRTRAPRMLDRSRAHAGSSRAHTVHFVSSSIVKQRRLGLAEALECEAI